MGDGGAKTWKLKNSIIVQNVISLFPIKKRFSIENFFFKRNGRFIYNGHSIFLIFNKNM